MASSQVMVTEKEFLGSYDSPDQSFNSSEFSIIPDPEKPPFAGENGITQSANSATLTSALMSATFDLNGDEIQKRLIELAEDNRSLRESLQNSSAIMKSDLTAIASWHNNITTTIAQQEISLQEARDKIKELEKEKQDLSDKLKETETKSKEIEEVQSSLKADNAVLSDEDSEYEIVQRKSKTAENMGLLLKNAEFMMFSLKEEIEVKNSKIENLKNKLEENEKEMITLKSQLSNQDHLNAKICDLLKQVAANEDKNKDLQAKVKDLEAQLQARDLEPAMDLAGGLLLNQVDEYQEKIKELKEKNEKAVMELEAKIKKLEEKLKWEQRAAEAEKVKHQEAKKLLTVMQSNYDRVTKILQLQSRNQKDKDVSEREIEAKKNLEQIDNLTAKLFDLEQQLEEREEKVVAVTKELSLHKEDSEAIPILKAQVEVLKVDLDNAVLAKEAGQEEILQLTQQLKDLQAQNTATFCSNCGAGSASADSPTRGGRGRRRNHSHKPVERTEPDLFVCPICQFGFTEFQALENHVNNCLDNSGQ